MVLIAASAPLHRCDIALLRLHTDAAINKYVQPATLPKPGDELSKKTTCYVTGWGMTKGESLTHTHTHTHTHTRVSSYCII